MLKKLATILMTGALFLAPFQTVNAAPNYFVTLDGVRQNVTPIVQAGTTLLPVATVGKLVGYQATWNNKTKSGTLEKVPMKISFKLGSYTLTKTEKDADYTISMPQPVKVINGKTYLPLRAVGEALGMKVGYNGSTREISLQTSSYISNTNTVSKSNKKIDYDNLTWNEWTKLSFDERKGATEEQRRKIIDRHFDSIPEENTKPIEQPKEDPKQDEKPSTSEPKVEEKTYSDEEIIEETLRLLNEERERLGLNKLEMRDDLNDFAKWKANYLVEKNVFTHRPDGISVDEQVKQYGIKGLACGENLTGLSSKRLTGAYDNWYKSKGHYKNMTDPNRKYIGLAISDKTMDYKGGQLYVVAMVLGQ